MSEKYSNFEEAFEKLKNIVSKFENSSVDFTLDDLISNYEKGMKAYDYCIHKLDDAQKKIEIIDSKFE